MSATDAPPRIRPHKRPDREPCGLDGHLDDDRLNNALANLVPSCLDCNTKRGRA